jgi:hypothetical protein
MGLTRRIEICSLSSMKGGKVDFYTPQNSSETMLVQIPAQIVDDLFVHHFQTDQLMVVRGEFVLVALQDRQYHYIPLSDRQPNVVKIPPGIPHAAINFSTEPCFLVNALLRHGPAHRLDYRPLTPPFPFDLKQAQASLAQHKLELSLLSS